MSYTDKQLLEISKAGTAVCGSCWGGGTNSPYDMNETAWHWDSGHGFTYLPTIPGDSNAPALIIYVKNISGDGSTVIVQGGDYVGRWTRATGMQSLGSLFGPGWVSYYPGLSAVSDNGRDVVFQTAALSGGWLPCKWSDDLGGLFQLPIAAGKTRGSANTISGNGQISYGNCYGGSVGTDYCRWDGFSDPFIMPGDVEYTNYDGTIATCWTSECSVWISGALYPTGITAGPALLSENGCVASNNKYWSIGTGLVTINISGFQAIGISNNGLVVTGLVGNSSIQQWSPSSGVLAVVSAGPDYSGFYNYSSGFRKVSSDGSVISTEVVISTLLQTLLLFRSTSYSISEVSLSSIVEDLCGKSGLTGVDVSELTDLVNGYVVGNRGSTRAALEPLQRAFFFDSVERDNSLKFVKRGAPPAITIPEDDLAASLSFGALPDNLKTTFQQELELPHEIAVKHFDNGSAYQQGVQYARRLTGNGVLAIDVDLPISMSASKARQVAEVLLWDAWMSRASFSCHVPRKYSMYEPTDVVGVTKGNAIHNCRIVSKQEAQGVFTWELVRESDSIYTQSLPAAEPLTPNETLTLIPSTIGYLLDIPMLRDADNNSGFYLAACPAIRPSAWDGAQLHRSVDAGVTWEAFGNSVVTPSVIGTVLGSLVPYSKNLAFIDEFDETSSIDVVVFDGGALFSVSEVLVRAGSNMALVGDEVVRFRDATLIATNTYTLTGFLRGRRGTDGQMNSHVAGERFVFLSLAMVRILSGQGALNVSQLYKLVSFNELLTDVTPFYFTDTGVCFRPYSPVNVDAMVAIGGDITISWRRRSRFCDDVNTLNNLILGEDVEAYEIEIMDGVTVVRTLTSSVQLVVYSAADQTTDFGSPQEQIDVRIYQLSTIYGRGTATVATVPLFRPAADALVLSGQAPIALVNSYQLPAAGSLTLTGQTPIASIGEGVQPTAGVVFLSGEVPTVVVA